MSDPAIAHVENAYQLVCADLLKRRSELATELDRIDTALGVLRPHATSAALRLVVPLPAVDPEPDVHPEGWPPEHPVDEEELPPNAPSEKPKASSGKVLPDSAQAIVAAITRSGRFLFSEQLIKELERTGIEKGWRFSELLKKLVAQGVLAKAQYGTSRRFTAYGLPAWTTRKNGALEITGTARHASGLAAASADVEVTIGGGDADG